LTAVLRVRSRLPAATSGRHGRGERIRPKKKYSQIICA